MAQYEMIDLTRDATGALQATIRYENGLTVVRGVSAITVEAAVHRAAESQDAGLPEAENLGVVAATYVNPARELRARLSGVGSVEVPCE